MILLLVVSAYKKYISALRLYSYTASTADVWSLCNFRMNAYERTEPRECCSENCNIYVKWISTHIKKTDASEITNY
jgi:hypothetical protein